MAKYLWEQLAQSIYPQSIVVRTSWLYGGGKQYKNFVNTILQLARVGNEIKVVDDEYGVPNSTYDVCLALWNLMGSIEQYRGKVLHFSSSSRDWVLSRFELAKYIWEYLEEVPKISPCSSQEYWAKAKRPKYSLLKNNSSIELPDWKIGIQRYIQDII
jgi:dTDP-4-dehydrorhamnose reductase